MAVKFGYNGSTKSVGKLKNEYGTNLKYILSTLYLQNLQRFSVSILQIWIHKDQHYRVQYATFCLWLKAHPCKF